MKVEPLTPVIGAEVLGVDLARLDDAQFARIEAALLDRQVRNAEPRLRCAHTATDHQRGHGNRAQSPCRRRRRHRRPSRRRVLLNAAHAHALPTTSLPSATWYRAVDPAFASAAPRPSTRPTRFNSGPPRPASVCSISHPIRSQRVAPKLVSSTVLGRHRIQEFPSRRRSDVRVQSPEPPILLGQLSPNRLL